MTARRGPALAFGLGVAMIAAVAFARGEPIAVIGGSRPPWLRDLLHELDAAGFAASADNPQWALQVTASPDRIAIVRRATAGDAWTIDEAVTVPWAPAARRRAIVRAVEILRARRAAVSLGPVAPAPPASAPAAANETAAPRLEVNAAPAPSVDPPANKTEPKPPAKPQFAPAAAATADIARTPPAARTIDDPRGRFSLGVGAGISGSSGGLGAVPAAGLVARLTAQRLTLWSRAAAAIVATTVRGAEGTANVRTLTLSLGAAFLPWDAVSRRWSPLLGAEAAALFARGTGDGATGYRGQTVLVSGMSAGAVAGLWFLVGKRVGVAVTGAAGIVLWEPAVSFAGRQAASLRGISAAANADLCWRF